MSIDSSSSLIFRQNNDDSIPNLLSNSPSVQSLREGFRRTESLSSHIGSIISNMTGSLSETSSNSDNSQAVTPKKRNGEF